MLELDLGIAEIFWKGRMEAGESLAETASVHRSTRFPFCNLTLTLSGSDVDTAMILVLLRYCHKAYVVNILIY